MDHSDRKPRQYAQSLESLPPHPARTWLARLCIAVYRIVDVVGISETSWEDAGRRAVETAASSLRDLRVAEVTKMDMKVDNGKVVAFRTRVALSFKYEA
jgi:flavin-binding protein dodecin